MIARLAGTVGVLVAVLGMFGWGTPVSAAPAAVLSASGVRATPGEVRFVLAARGMSLDNSTISVRLAGVPLRTRTSSAALRRGVVVVFDTSGSMAGTPLAAARSWVTRYAEAQGADAEVGLVTTGGRARTVLAPTTDRAALDRTVSRLAAKGRTALYDGLHLAAGLLPATGPDRYADRRILVLSDGADTASATTLEQLDEIAAAGPTVDVIAFGRHAGGAALHALAERSGGRVVIAADTAALAAALVTLTAHATQVRVDVPADQAGRAGRLEIEVVAGSRRVVTSVPVRFAAVPPVSVRVPAGPGWLLPGAATLTASGLFLVLALVLRPGFAQRREQQRLAEIEQHRSGRALAARSGAEPSVHPIAAVMLGWTDRMVKSRSSTERITLQLERAGLTLRPNEWLLLRICVALVVAALSLVLLPWWAAVLLGGPAGWLATRLYLGLRGGRRTRGFTEQLPDALQLVIGALRSGFSLPQSLDVLVREGGEPVAGEFGRALAKTRLGIELESALDEVAERTGSQDLEWLVMAIRIQREIGGNLAEVLQTTVDTMRERTRLRRHVRALSAEGRLSAWVLTVMPIAVGGWLGLTRGEYLRPLVTEPMGIAMLSVSVVMVAVGAFWMSRLVKVEV